MRLVLPAAAGTLLLVALAPAPPARAQDATWALTNARIETVTRGVIDRGTIVIRRGLIAAVGAEVTPPADARVLDLSGRTVYPGLIDLTSSLGLAAPPSPAGGRGAPGAAAAPAAAGAPVGLEPERLVADEFKPAAADVRTLRDGGITAVLIAPTRGAFRGLSALVPMDDSLTARAIVRSPVGLHLGFEGAVGYRYPATLLGVIAYERQAFYDAKRQALLLDRYRANPRGMERPPYDAGLAALIPVVRGELPAFFAASDENEIRRAVDIGREFGLKLTVVGATEGFRALDALSTNGQPVVVSVDFPKPNEVTGWRYRGTFRHAPEDSASADSAARPVIEGNAAALDAAGIRFALASGGTLGPAQFLVNVRKAIAAGLPRDVALQALTIRPAQIAGAGEQLGSIESGKIANLVVTEGDLLGDSAKIRDVFVDGTRYEVVPPARPPRGRGAGAEAAADLGGTWDVTVTTPQGSNQATMTVTQSGTTFTGQLTSQMGTTTIDNGEVAGLTATWEITFTSGGQSLTVTFHGEVEGNRMRGTVDMPGMEPASFTAQKRTP
jgi:imidazolonepropionase-like amidohydrolase